MEEVLFLILWPLLPVALLVAALWAREGRFSLRFSMRAILIATTLFAIWMGIAMSLYYSRK